MAAGPCECEGYGSNCGHVDDTSLFMDSSQGALTPSLHRVFGKWESVWSEVFSSRMRGAERRKYTMMSAWVGDVDSQKLS